MTEPTRPLADGPLAEEGPSASGVTPGLEEVPAHRSRLLLTIGSPTAVGSDGFATASRHLLEEAGTLVGELGLGGRAMRGADLDNVAPERRAALAATLRRPTRIDGSYGPLLLPLWRSLTDDDLRIVVSLSSLLTVAESAPRSEVALARHERDLRALLDGAAGLDVEIILDGGDLGAEPDDVDPEIVELQRLVASIAGRHRSFAPPVPGPESRSGAALVALAFDLEQSTAALSFFAGQLEVVLRGDVERSALSIRTNHDEEEEEEELVEPTEDGRYPLDASQDRVAYHRWLAARREPTVLGGAGDPLRTGAATRAPRQGDPLVSLLVPVFRPPLWALQRCVASVLAQSAADWELILVDDGGGDAEVSAYLASLPRLDRRIRVGALAESEGISQATNAAFELSRGRYIGYLDHDDELPASAVATIAAHIARHPEAEFFYSDEDKIDERGERFDPYFKPEWSPDLLLSFAYTCHLSVYRRELVAGLGGLRSAFDGSQDYDLALRASERAHEIVHIPEILYHWRSLSSSVASGSGAKPWAFDAGRRAIADAMDRRGEPAEVTEHPRFPGRYDVRRHITSRPLVSAIIPFRDQPALLATCTTSLREAPGYDNLELVLVDNGSELPETEALLEELARQPDVRIVRAPGPFNWAAINNAAAHEATGELLLFMNNDIEARVPGWLDALVGHAQRPEVGAVGARLVYPDGSIQHAGVVIGLGGIAGHVLRGLPSHLPGYSSMAISTRDCSVVTGACMMVRRELFEGVGGFDEELPVAFNDVDFCLKLRAEHKLIVYASLAELVHHESKSRGHTDDLAENQRIRERWEEALVAGDPYMNIHLSHWRYWCPLSTAQEDYRWKVYLETPPQPLDS